MAFTVRFLTCSTILWTLGIIGLSTLKQFVSNSQWIVWVCFRVCLTILWGWCSTPWWMFQDFIFPFYLQQPTLTWKTAELQLKNWMIWVSLKTFQVISRKSLNCTMGNGIIVKLSLKPTLRVTNLCRIHYIYPPISSFL